MSSNGFHKILVATDFSPASGPAMREATKLRLVLGSVAARVAASSPCPVLTVRAG